MPTKIHIVKAMVFPVAMYGCESWTMKKAECQRIDAFELWYWRRLLRVPWTERRSNQSIVKEINLEYSLEGLVLKLKLPYFGHLMGEREDELKGLLMRGKEESEKDGLKLNIQKTKTMASGPITSWQIDGETMETVTDFILGGSKITADFACSHEIKRCLLLGRKVMTNVDSILKSRDTTLLTKVRLIKAMVFPVVMYR